MTKKFQFYDSAGVLRNVKTPYFYASDGSLRKVKDGYFYDSAGVLRHFFSGSVAGVESAFFPGAGTRGTVAYYLFTVPAGITAIHACVIGGGGSGAIKNTTPKGGGAGGGALVYANDIPVTPGEVLRIYPGAGGPGKTGTTAGAGTVGQDAYIQRTNGTYVILAGGGKPGTTTAGGLGGTGSIVSGTGVASAGGPGGLSTASVAGGGGAGGYGGAGGTGGGGGASGTDGSGGGGGGGAAGSSGTAAYDRGGQGGGTGIFGAGANGAAGVYNGFIGDLAKDAKSGSGGNDPALLIFLNVNQSAAGQYGGGGAAANMITGNTGYSGYGGPGAVMIRWGASPTFPTYQAPPQQTHDFICTPAADGIFIGCGPTNALSTGNWGPSGTLTPYPPTLGSQKAFLGLNFSTYDNSWQFYIGNQVEAILTPADLVGIFKTIQIDGLGALNAATALCDASLIGPGYGYAYVKWPESECPRWTAGGARTCRILY